MKTIPILLKIVYIVLSIIVIWFLPIPKLTRSALLLSFLFMYWGLSRFLSKKVKI